MNENYKFILHTTYDKPAYQALSEVSWVLFRKHRMQVAAYPALFSLAALIAIILIFNWGSYDTPLLVGGLVFIGLQFLVIPLGAVSAKHKMCRTAIKEVSKTGAFPLQVRLVFLDKQIHSTIDNEVSTVPYGSIDCLMSLGDWRLLMFGRAAYILHRSCFQSQEELREFEAFISEKCGLPFNQMKGKGPKR
ncbi:MAG: YcxB family protein [Flavonifractor sp.]|jgi:hypothetical protein|nr:YcxB family protein [Flavonifractor sp.]MCI9472696.1 YcxB family protein [Flavonifractor sp.]